jgi:anti-anti-sigma factor
MAELPTTFLTASLEGEVLALTVTITQLEGQEVAEVLKREMLAAVERTGATRVVIDLSRARYVSSIAFWPLLALRRHLLDRGGRLLLSGLTGPVLDVFTMTKMVVGSGPVNAPFEVAPDLPTAVATLRQA